MKTFTSTEYDADSISGLGVFTLVLWLGCLLIGGFGFALHYSHPRAPQAQPPPLKVEMLEVKLTEDSQPTPESSPNSAVTDPLAQPQIPQPVAVAQPSPAIAFALSVKGPVRVVEARQAAYSQPSSPAPTAEPLPQRLTFGEGEGRQPAPDYPRRAQQEGQEGGVLVRFTVAESGHVTAVEALEPCRWPLLNQSALRVVKERWRFSPGPLRVYDVQIRFILTQ
ncbi:MAG TPA: TonB family protein [Verrucomicrobiae bacterium]|jgi:protein TonB|nr:TonB family protein [Verrucomicrobiae bacterium]